MKTKFFSMLLLASFAISCGGGKDATQDIIQENVEFAKAQLAHLIDAAEAGDTLQIPSSYKNGKIEFVPTDDWVSGFFAGTLWYMYELTGDEFYAQKAQKHTEILHDIQYLKWHHDVGFMVYDSYGNGRRLKNIPGYDTVLVNTAKSLATRFREKAGIIQSWNTDNPDHWQAHKGWDCPVIIDNMMNLELFFEVSKMTGDDTYKNIAISHADKTIENHFREDYSTYHVVDYNDETGEVRRKCTAQGIADESRWARGQAWAIYGYTVAYRYTKDEKYLKQAENIANYLLVNEDNMPEDLVPLWDFDVAEFAADGEEMVHLFSKWVNIFEDPQTTEYYKSLRDVSSAAIIASALYELNWYTKNDMYKEKADKMIESLSKAPYRADVGTNGGFLFKHSVGSLPHSHVKRVDKKDMTLGNIDVPLNYADYYFLEALIRKGRIEKGENPIK